MAARAPRRPIRTIDIRGIPGAFWSAVLAGAFETVEAGGAFDLTADEDPLAVCDLIDAVLPGRFRCRLLEAGPPRWRVRFERNGPAAASDSAATVPAP